VDFAYTAGFELTDRFGRLAYRASEMIMKIEHGLIAEMLTVNPMFRSTAEEVLIGA